VSEENPVRAIEVFVDELDLGALGFSGVTPAATGRPGYHPGLMLKLYVYGYLNQIASSRRLEREAQRNIELMWLTGRLAPDCIFYLTGELHGSSAHVSTYFPEGPATDLIKGELVLETHQKFRVRLPSEHGGCWNVEHFADEDQPAQFTLQASPPWTSIAVAKRDKTYFFDTPASAPHRKAYLVKGDGVGVRTTQPGWLEVDFVGGDKPVSGWIRQSDVYPADQR
jgi:Transposase domain (DUF772)